LDTSIGCCATDFKLIRRKNNKTNKQLKQCLLIFKISGFFNNDLVFLFAQLTDSYAVKHNKGFPEGHFKTNI